MNDVLLDVLKKYLTFIRKTGNGEYIFRCPVCGDSVKKHHGHLYINEEGKFICFRCGFSGRNIFYTLPKVVNVDPEDK